MRIAYNPDNRGEWKPLPEGTYDFQILEVEEKTSSKGNPQLYISTEVVGGEFSGKKCGMYFAATENATWRIVQLLEATGVAFEQAGTDLDFDENDLIGSYFQANAGIREYNGKKNNDFSKFEPSSLSAGPADEPAEEEEEAPAPPAKVAKAAPAPTTRALTPRGRK